MRLLTHVDGIPASQQSRYLALKKIDILGLAWSTDDRREKQRTYEQRIRKVELGTFTHLVFSTSGGMAKSTSDRRLVIAWVCCHLSFSLPRSAVTCLCGARSSSGHAIHNGQSTAPLSREVGGISCLKMVSEAISDPPNTTIVLGEHVAIHYCQYLTCANECSHHAFVPRLSPNLNPPQNIMLIIRCTNCNYTCLYLIRHFVSKLKMTNLRDAIFPG